MYCTAFLMEFSALLSLLAACLHNAINGLWCKLHEKSIYDFE